VTKSERRFAIGFAVSPEVAGFRLEQKGLPPSRRSDKH
jgi:hypothetical protein